MDKKVLIIDDEVDFCVLLKAHLTRHHYLVRVSHTLSEGIEEAKKFLPDIILLDNNLPDGLGYSLISYFIHHYPHLQLHLISAHHTELPYTEILPSLKVWEKPISLLDLEESLSK